MSQQLAIIVMVDIEAAIKANSLANNTYLFDNMRLQGSEGQGTGQLVTAINGTRYIDGSQANEQVLNWLPYGVGTVPPTVPKTFYLDKARNSDLKALEDLTALAERIDTTEKDKFGSVEQVVEEIKRISQTTGLATKVQSKPKLAPRDIAHGGLKVMDVTGELLNETEDTIPEISHITPIITDITGEAIDKKVMYPAQYGSPDLVTDGWYWSASVDTSRPGTYAYVMHFQLYKLSYIDEQWTWVPVNMKYESHIKVTSKTKVNGFTGAGVGMLPIPHSAG